MFLLKLPNILSSSKDETIDARQRTRQKKRLGKRPLAELMRKIPNLLRELGISTSCSK
jgi:hypothetical protein